MKFTAPSLLARNTSPAGSERRSPWRFRSARMKVSVVVPVYNERALIVDVLRKVSQAPFSKELVVVDDCSTDGTRAILEKLAADPAEVISADPRGQTELRVFFQPVNGGKGARLPRGFPEA